LARKKRKKKRAPKEPPKGGGFSAFVPIRKKEKKKKKGTSNRTELQPLQASWGKKVFLSFDQKKKKSPFANCRMRSEGSRELSRKEKMQSACP